MAKPYKKSSIPDFQRLAHKVRDAAINLANKAVREFAQDEANGFRQAIRQQDFASFTARPLSPGRILQKMRAGADLRVMIATKHYVNSIRVFHTRSTDGRGGTFRIGFHPSAHARTLDGDVAPVTLNQVAYWQEHGVRKTNLPARPHWRPYLQGLRRRAILMREELAGRVVKEARKAMRR